jgi:predicted dehydrogenase
MKRFPKSIAIAGAWGYIGRRFLDAALAMKLETHVFDPGKPPNDLDLGRVTRAENDEAFYRLPADLFHLALHPEHRKRPLAILLERAAAGEPILVLNEKPMAPPERPGQCVETVGAIRRSGAVVLYDFPELFDPMTQRIRDFLAGFANTRITSIYVQRSKDREDPRNPRNLKRMVPIQFQESVHCLAFALQALALVRGGLEPLFAGGFSIAAQSAPYNPPNPEAYPYDVDGKVSYLLNLAGARIEGLNDFKSGAQWTKRRILHGVGDERPFVIDAEYLEGGKRLTIDGADQGFSPKANSYAAVIETAGRWYRTVPRDELLRGLYPHPEFARLAYQLSSVLWRSSRDRAPIRIDSLESLLSYNAGFAEAVGCAKER